MDVFVFSPLQTQQSRQSNQRDLAALDILSGRSSVVSGSLLAPTSDGSGAARRQSGEQNSQLKNYSRLPDSGIIATGDLFCHFALHSFPCARVFSKVAYKEKTTSSLY